jgi:hypothetical protein
MRAQRQLALTLALILDPLAILMWEIILCESGFKSLLA